MKKGFHNLSFFSLFLLTLALASCSEEEALQLSVPDDEQASSIDGRSNQAGAVYLMDNDVTENKAIVFTRNADGTLGGFQTYPTGGQGTGGGLGSQSAVVLEKNFLFVCNPGSNEISVFGIRGNRLILLDVEPSQGVRPVSLTVSKDILYVLNAGGTGNIAGFRLSRQGITFLPGSVQPLSSDAAAAAQVSFNQGGNLLAVTERATNAISIYAVGRDGIAGPPSTFPSVGDTPFGFEFGKRDQLIVSDAFGGAAGASALTSYHLGQDGQLSLITGPVATNQTAACWVALTNDGRYAYTTNTGSGSVTGYRISTSGALNILDPSGVTGQSGAGPIDMAFSRNSSYLYTLNAGDDSITQFERNADGSLTSLGSITGLPDGAAGMAAE